MLNTVAKRMRHFCSHLRTKEMLDDVEDDVWWKSNFAQHHPTSCNMLAKWVQHVGWCCINMLDPFGWALSRNIRRTNPLICLMLFSLVHKHMHKHKKNEHVLFFLCLCANEISIRQISGFVLLLMLMLMSQMSSLARTYVMLMLVPMLMR